MEEKPKHSNGLVLSQGIILLFGGMALLGVQLMLLGHYEPERDDFAPVGASTAFFAYYCVGAAVFIAAAIYYWICARQKRQPRAIVFHVAAVLQVVSWLSLIAWMKS